VPIRAAVFRKIGYSYENWEELTRFKEFSPYYDDRKSRYTDWEEVYVEGDAAGPLQDNVRLYCLGYT
jgi:hypothetical protein